MRPDAAITCAPPKEVSRISDYLQIVRPRMAMLVLFTVSTGWILGAVNGTDLRSLVDALIGSGLMFAGASALNQVLERDSDALMPRTANRPLPAGRISPWEVLIMGSCLSLSGLVYLFVTNQRLGASLGGIAIVSYVVIYTPLKRLTTFNTLVGAVPGAIPVLMGWAAARGDLDSAALPLFMVIVLWQIPHFLAIAWIYRKEYEAAGHMMLPVADPGAVQTGLQMKRYTLSLILASLSPGLIGLSSWIAGFAAAVLGVAFLCTVIAFARVPTTDRARQVFRASLAYLPAVLVIYVLDARLLNGTWV